ncbi:hypothetical protein RH915_06955 [Serpentinicella sp. ANB-PHB4]|uniref:hypothetical protein n=1 Tax=Serpentinicella sp. ANB-PHB4 TaxID=3074076 RepID=UPI002858AD4D|nr:hypothetical protein [Serpentinicella sp. ANB-PHB4]MDR5659225.1 hypothetical protein [Serpentinicella sp. ANB-PHB4]
MAFMLKQTVKKSKKPFRKITIYMLIALFLINIGIELTNNLPSKLGHGTSIVLLVLGLILCFYLVNASITAYTYTLIGDELTIAKEVGKKEKKILNIKVSDIQSICLVKEAQGTQKQKEVSKLCCKTKGKKSYLVEYFKNNEKKSFIFEPNNVLYEELQRQFDKNS